MIRSGFSLTEVLVALVVLQVCLMGAVGLTVLAARALGEAEQRERVVSVVEATVDSLATVQGPASGVRREAWGELQWSVDSDGRIDVRAVREAADTLEVRGQAR